MLSWIAIIHDSQNARSDISTDDKYNFVIDILSVSVCCHVSTLNVCYLQLQHQNIFGVRFPICLNPLQNISLERSWSPQKKAAVRRQSSVLHCEKTAAIGACPPTPVGVLWYSSFTQIETERLLYILYLFLWKPQLEMQPATELMTFTILIVNISSSYCAWTPAHLS